MMNARVTYENGTLWLSFERAVDTGDSRDWKLSADDSYHFLFPVGGGRHANTDFSAHEYTPVISEQKMSVGKLSVDDRDAEGVEREGNEEAVYPSGASTPWWCSGRASD